MSLTLQYTAAQYINDAIVMMFIYNHLWTVRKVPYFDYRWLKARNMTKHI